MNEPGNLVSDWLPASATAHLSATQSPSTTRSSGTRLTAVQTWFGTTPTIPPSSGPGPSKETTAWCSHSPTMRASGQSASLP